jgi:hypothetical protein
MSFIIDNILGHKVEIYSEETTLSKEAIKFIETKILNNSDCGDTKEFSWTIIQTDFFPAFDHERTITIASHTLAISRTKDEPVPDLTKEQENNILSKITKQSTNGTILDFINEVTFHWRVI